MRREIPIKLQVGPHRNAVNSPRERKIKRLEKTLGSRGRRARWKQHLQYLRTLYLGQDERPMYNDTILADGKAARDIAARTPEAGRGPCGGALHAEVAAPDPEMTARLMDRLFPTEK